MSVSSFRVGTDIIAVERVGRLLHDRGRAFLDRWFTEAEIAYCVAKADPAQHLAARLAAKEAVVKVIRIPWDGPIPYRFVEISADPQGSPIVRLSGRVAQAAARSGIGPIEVSLSHCREYAVAVAMASGLSHDRGEQL